jgi:hypothetical protein
MDVVVVGQASGVRIGVVVDGLEVDLGEVGSPGGSLHRGWLAGRRSDLSARFRGGDTRIGVGGCYALPVGCGGGGRAVGLAWRVGA